MFRILLILVGLSIPSYSQEPNSRIDELNNRITQQGQVILEQDRRIEHLEHLIAHDHRTQPTLRKILPADKILGASIVIAMVCACSYFIDSGNIILTFANFATYLYTFYGLFKIIRNTATVAGNSTLVAKATRD